MLTRVSRAARYLILPLIVFASSLLWILQENQQFAQYRAELESEQETHVADSEATRVAMTSAIDGLMYRQEFTQERTSRAGWNFLRTAYEFFERRLNRPHSGSAGSSDRILDLSYFIRVSWKIRKFKNAEDALDELLALTSDVDETSAELMGVRIIALNWKSCLQINYRNPEAALVTAQECIESCERFLGREPGNLLVQEHLSQALRNCGVIEEVLGRDGSHSVDRAVSVASSFQANATDLFVVHQLVVNMFLVDAKQMLGFLHLRHSRHDEALVAWLDALSECQNLIQLAEELGRNQSISIPVLRFRKAKRRLEYDLEQLRATKTGIRDEASREGEIGLVAESHESAAAAQWAWTPLSSGDGLSELAIDRLIHGVLPGEFEPQEAILVSWPADNSWSRSTVLQAVRAIQETTPVVLLVPDEEVREEAVEEILSDGLSFDRIEVVTMETDTIWARDYGPLIVKCGDGAVRIASSMFSGSFEDPAPANDFLSVAWSRATGWPLFRLPVLIEAGALLSNGAGLCLASEYLLVKNAASGIERAQVTNALKRLTGADQVVYLLPLFGEETEHVDWFTAFTSPDTVVVGDYYGVDDFNSKILDENARRLSGIMTRNGPLRVERIPMPPRGKGYFGGTYTNVVFANGNLLVPTWPEASRKTEEKALDVYRRLLPDWKIVPIESLQLGRKQGSLHCATMNLYRYRPPTILAKERRVKSADGVF